MDKDHKRLYRALLLSSVLMPTVLGLGMGLLWYALADHSLGNAVPDATTSPEYIYVYLEEEAQATIEQDSLWIVREHKEKIGIFSSDGILLQVWDVYIKALPKADRQLLREGITVTSRQDLYALMADYGA